MPPIGLGTFPLQCNDMADAVKKCLEVGYRLIDTSDDYRGEGGIGLAVDDLSSVKLKREDIFLQTKVTDDDSYDDESLTGIYFNPNSKYMQRHSVEEVVKGKVENSLYSMHTDYIDSLLIHQPYPYYFVDIWKVFIKLREEGVVRHIGVSNFHKRHIDQLIKETGVIPEINECYASPIATKESLVEYCNNIGCLFMTYSPLKDLVGHRISEVSLLPMMEKYGKSIAQLILRWNIERGCMPLPKSSSLKRLSENFDVFDFALTKEEVATISAMNIDYQLLVESKICAGL